jgi:hypothetical protein
VFGIEINQDFLSALSIALGPLALFWAPTRAVRDALEAADREARAEDRTA